MIDPAMRLQILRVLHHKIFGTWPRVERTDTPLGQVANDEWIAWSHKRGEDKAFEHVNNSEETALYGLIYTRIREEHPEYEENLKP